MALPATLYRVSVTLSDVDRSVYASLELRLAQHPSETTRYMVTRLLAYCLLYEEGIAFSKGGLSSTDEPALSIRDRAGQLQAWIEVGAPSAERLHKAAKASPAVHVFTTGDLEQLRREAKSRPIFRGEEVKVHLLDASFVDGIGAEFARTTTFELVHAEGEVYVTVNTKQTIGQVSTVPLLQGHRV